MGKHNDLIYLEHVRESIRWIEEFVSRAGSKAGFEKDRALQDAIIREIEVIGEALRNVRQEFRMENPGLPWDEAIGMRDKLIHDYMGVDLDKVWETATLDVPRLKTQLEQILKR